MGKKQELFERLGKDAVLSGQPFPGQPIIEIAGESRVLVENHFGVCEYSRERIIVKVTYGCILICGCGLELARMSKEQLIVCGRIDAVAIQRRN